VRFYYSNEQFQSELIAIVYKKAGMGEARHAAGERGRAPARDWLAGAMLQKLLDLRWYCCLYY
jgi:hypothetical protein